MYNIAAKARPYLGAVVLTTALFTAGNFPSATEEFSKAEALNPNLPSLHSYYGQALLFTGDADGAMQASPESASAPRLIPWHPYHLALRPLPGTQ